MEPIKKVQIVSRFCGPFLFPEEHDEVEQHLTLRADGKYWVSGYEYDEESHSNFLARKLQGSIFPGKEKAIFEKLAAYCAEDPFPLLHTDCGTWEMTVTYADGSRKKNLGSLTEEDTLLNEISRMIRTELDMFDLNIFDGVTSNPCYENGPIRIFKKYLPLLYENTYLWNRFSELCQNYFWEKRQQRTYFAFQRDTSCIQVWLGFLDNMGGGIPLYFFHAAAFIILAYKDAGHDIDAELAECAIPAELSDR